jgi:hypothetical protein
MEETFQGVYTFKYKECAIYKCMHENLIAQQFLIETD